MRSVSAEVSAMRAARDDASSIMDEVYRVVVEKVRLKLESMDEVPMPARAASPSQRVVTRPRGAAAKHA
ncbi:MAG: hypothetical protein K2X32_00325 [Phycisphaerales bacterium]|nr:hypothetical protein [Phycisphaerales bacterium]